MNRLLWFLLICDIFLQGDFELTDRWSVEVELEQYRASSHPYHSKECSIDVLDVILENHGIDNSLVQYEEARTRIHSKIRKLGAEASLKGSQTRGGGDQLVALLKKWEAKRFILNLASSNLKRKLESDVETERNQRRKVELNTAKNNVKGLEKAMTGIFKRKFQVNGTKSKKLYM